MISITSIAAIARRCTLAFGVGGLAIAAMSLGTPSVAALFDGPLDDLSVEARVAVREGAAYVHREGNQFRGYVLVDAPNTRVWDVLTDYDRFPLFLPNTDDYTVLSESAASSPAIKRTLQVESVTSAQVLLLKVQSRDRFDLVEQPFERIEFALVRSETLREMTGAWTLQVVERTGKDPQVLIGYEATATPHNQFSAGAFGSIFQTQLEGTLTAIRDEIGRRGS